MLMVLMLLGLLFCCREVGEVALTKFHAERSAFIYCPEDGFVPPRRQSETVIINIGQEIISLL